MQLTKYSKLEDFRTQPYDFRHESVSPFFQRVVPFEKEGPFDNFMSPTLYRSFECNFESPQSSVSAKSLLPGGSQLL